MIKKKDKIFASEKMKVSDFSFNKEVANAFDDMVSRSVPNYFESQNAAIKIASKYIKNGTNVVDIGCSTGTTLINLSDELTMSKKRRVKYIGIDSSSDMIEIANRKIKNKKNKSKFKFIVDDFMKTKLKKNISCYFMHFTLQFIRPIEREIVLEKIYGTMKSGGCLILLEKVLSNDKYFNRTFIDIYHEYKISKQGYSNVEIQKKREALENVLIPYKVDENVDLLKNAGFKKIEIFYRWFNWTGFIAVK